MKNWKKLFASRILNRGYEYYIDDLVEDLYRDGDTVYATVNGADDYEVEITLYGGEVEDMFCSCPYAEDGNYCKHMAAVLYELEEGEDVPEKAPVSNNIDEIVNSADEKYVRSFLINILNENELLRQRFVTLMSNQQRSVKEYKKLVDTIIRTYTNQSGYVEYHDAETMLDELLDLADDIDFFIESGQLLDAFELSCYLMQETLMTDPDHENVYLLYDHLVDDWYKIVEAASAEEKDIIFEKLLNDRGNISRFTKSFLYNAFREPRFIPKLFEMLDNEIAAAKNDRYKYDNVALQKIKLMTELQIDFDEIERNCRQYWDSDGVRRWLAEQYEQRGQVTDAIKIYEESILLDRDHRGLVTQYREKLVRLYQQIGDDEKYMQVLWLLVTDDQNVEYYRELKSNYTADEWPVEREKVFQSYSSIALANLYCEEKLYDRLWELLKDEGLYMVLRYEDVLLPKHSVDILKKYQAYLNQAAKRADGRQAYQDWVRILKRMQKINGGKELAQQIANEWRVKYKNRRAMMEELRKL